MRTNFWQSFYGVLELDPPEALPPSGAALECLVLWPRGLQWRASQLTGDRDTGFPDSLFWSTGGLSKSRRQR